MTFIKLVKYVIVFVIGCLAGILSLSFSNGYIERKKYIERNEDRNQSNELYVLFHMTRYLKNTINSIKASCEMMFVLFCLGLAYVVVYCVKGFNAVTVIVYMFMMISTIITFTDIKVYEIPDLCICTSILVWFIFLKTSYFELIPAIILSLYVYLISYLTELFIKRETMGMGDIKLIFTAGLFLGIRTGIYAVLCSSILALMYSLIYRKKMVPFGPFICFSVLVFLLLR